MERRVAEAFLIFDVYSNKTINKAVIGSVLRFLGCVPTEKEIKDIIKATEMDGENAGNVHLAKFLPHVCQMLILHKMEPASADDLFEAFLLLDPEETGYISKDLFVKVLTEDGEPMNSEEIEEVLLIAVDPLTGMIPYEYYLNQLFHDPKDSIYKVAAEVEAERIARISVKPRFSAMMRMV